eukprot:CAMPEP_0114498750 /NCGR_PEP_ID=MMETSP0109-20121206/7042_1 /TAXON_ID=29199 /ORGANISM="Chlorarachnion reptans, Strain CCCM449" /LENGTH=146 /DNA_ID=CAMNT_0001676255 /DNA_START=1476 /DNA_END=1913 /DNA_ORIENTATION=-
MTQNTSTARSPIRSSLITGEFKSMYEYASTSVFFSPVPAVDSSWPLLMVRYIVIQWNRRMVTIAKHRRISSDGMRLGFIFGQVPFQRPFHSGYCPVFSPFAAFPARIRAKRVERASICTFPVPLLLSIARRKAHSSSAPGWVEGGE